MKHMTVDEIRESYLQFFENKDHLRLKSFSLVPENDKGLLIINAGMAPMKAFFTGLQTPPSKRVTTCQKCVRTGDIDNVGKTSRHGTFFEMLGNFSFGDYFKEEIIPWAWEYVTQSLQIPKEKLYVTIYLEDDEAYDIWTKHTDIDPKRIFRLGKEDNFWEIGQGPCGPSSEIHYDRGAGEIHSVEEFIKASGEDKIVEFWNLVFTQFDKDEEGKYNPLANPNIDTGMGLERIATIIQGTNSIFEIDNMRAILDEVTQLAKTSYGTDKKTDISMRVITDHVRSITFMISDGILPSNEGRGYVLRRILRRAARHGRLLGIKGIFLHELCGTVIENFYKAYPELKEKEDYIKKIIKLEEERFEETIDSGMQILKDYIEALEQKGEKILSGEKAFKLYDTYGFPYELTEEILEEKELEVDLEGFNEQMKNQKERARAAREESSYMGGQENILNLIPGEIETTFDGYDKVELQSTVRCIIREDQFVETLQKGEKGIILTEKTPFYAEMGGQIGDQGILQAETFKAKVEDCQKNIAGKILHFVEVLEGAVQIGEEIALKVDTERRAGICKNHTATHMIHEALKKVLGDHVRQAGSYVEENRLRFDFSHFTALTTEELEKVENIVNENIMKVHEVQTQVMDIETAKQSGAVALFDDKYKEDVRVVAIGEYSKELCGGTHVRNAGEIGLFKIVSEAGVAAGVRRIEAVTGMKAMKYMEEKNHILKEIANTLKCAEKDILNKVHAQLAEVKEKEKEIAILKSKLTSGLEEEILAQRKMIKEIPVIAAALEGIDGNALRDLADKLRDKLTEGVVVLGSTLGDKVQFVAMASKGATTAGIHCGKIIKEVAQIAGGGGGGRPDMAQAGGKMPEKLKEAIEQVHSIVEALVK